NTVFLSRNSLLYTFECLSHTNYNKTDSNMFKSNDLKVFRQSALKLVNEKRALHGAQPLKSSNKRDKSAQLWAEALVGKAGLENSAEAQRGEYGESISCRTSQLEKVDISAEDVINSWYGEKANYNFKDGTGKAGNFTQMVWLDSRKVGFGKAHAYGKVVVVAHYSPPGNYRNQYSSRVLPDLTDDMAGFRIAVREVLRDEEVIGGKPVTVELERTQLEDDKGNTREMVTERRRERQKPADEDKAEGGEPEIRQGAPVPIKEKDLSKFGKELLNQVNRHRSKHGVKSLKLSNDLTILAQSFAEELSRKSKLYNSSASFKGERLGESIASRWSNGPTDYTGEEVADHWYSEMEKFRFNEEPNDIKGVGNFTQMVWKNSKELGVGKAIHRGTDGSHRVVVVCYFHPAGNIVPCFRENVFPASK
ncbi:hypothetical protein BOX15_Mlig033836g3, partial [Macrostomum lignano]